MANSVYIEVSILSGKVTGFLVSEYLTSCFYSNMTNNWFVQKYYAFLEEIYNNFYNGSTAFIIWFSLDIRRNFTYIKDSSLFNS